MESSSTELIFEYYSSTDSTDSTDFWFLNTRTRGGQKYTSISN